jgi:hypothetical protein
MLQGTHCDWGHAVRGSGRHCSLLLLMMIMCACNHEGGHQPSYVTGDLTVSLIVEA